MAGCEFPSRRTCYFRVVSVVGTAVVTVTLAEDTVHPSGHVLHVFADSMFETPGSAPTPRDPSNIQTLGNALGFPILRGLRIFVRRVGTYL